MEPALPRSWFDFHMTCNYNQKNLTDPHSYKTNENMQHPCGFSTAQMHITWLHTSRGLMAMVFSPTSWRDKTHDIPACSRMHFVSPRSLKFHRHHTPCSHFLRHQHCRDPCCIRRLYLRGSTFPTTVTNPVRNDEKHINQSGTRGRERYVFLQEGFAKAVGVLRLPALLSSFRSSRGGLCRGIPFYSSSLGFAKEFAYTGPSTIKLCLSWRVAVGWRTSHVFHAPVCLAGSLSVWPSLTCPLVLSLLLKQIRADKGDGTARCVVRSISSPCYQAIWFHFLFRFTSIWLNCRKKTFTTLMKKKTGQTRNSSGYERPTGQEETRRDKTRLGRYRTLWPVVCFSSPTCLCFGRLLHSRSRPALGQHIKVMLVSCWSVLEIPFQLRETPSWPSRVFVSE